MILAKYDRARFEEEVFNGISASTEQIHKVIDQLSEEQLNFKLNPEKWSVAENIAHLVKSTASYKPGIENALAKKKLRKGETVVKLGFMGKLIAKSMEPSPTTKKMKTFRTFEPTQSHYEKQALKGDWQESQDYLLSIQERAKDLSYSKSKLSSPASGLIKLRLAGAMMTLMVHQKRHIQQIEELLSNSDFPVTGVEK